MKFKAKQKSPSDYAPAGTKDCQMKCEREVIMTKNGPVVVCNGCNRIVIDNRNGK